MKVCMFVKNSFEYDARVTKEAETLIDAGHEVTVVALHAPETTVPRETTASGIHVVRVSRSNLGGPGLNRLAARYGTAIESRHARLTGEDVDADRIRDHSTIAPPSTATPGETASTTEMPTRHPGASTSPPRLLWARLTTPFLRLIPDIAKGTYRSAKRILGPAGRRIQQRAIDRRMVAAGLSTRATIFHSHDLNTLRVGSVCRRLVET